jgi:hypothetical protein
MATTLNPDVYSRKETPAVAAPLEFTPCDAYTTFRAEHAFKGDDIVFHFYKTPEHSDEAYWTEIFPDALSEVAQAHYGRLPRVRAALTREPAANLDSWWMHAAGFASVGQPLKKVAAFYAALDAALESRIVSLPARLR